MIRKLKVLSLAAMVLAAFAAIDSSGAAAAEYHCSTAESFCKGTLFPDGTGKTAHHVFVAKKGGASGTVTATKLHGQATVAKTSSEATVTELAYTECNLAGSACAADTIGCDFLFKSNGGAVSVVCEAGKTIKITAGACTIEIGPQNLTGITYTNINSKKELTVSTNVKNIAGVAGAGCAGLLGFTGAFTEGEYTTGNTIAKGYEDKEGVEGAQVNGWWE